MSAVVVQLDGEVAECGDVVTGVVAWQAGHAPARSAVVLRHRCEGAGLVDENDGHRPVRWDENGRFSCPVPATGPISFSGALLTVSWSLQVVDLAGPETLASVPITVVPTGGLAMWAQRAAGPPVAP